MQDRAFNVEDLVLHLVQSNKDRHKLSPPWEGPYVVVEVLWLGTYKLKNHRRQGIHQCMEHRAATSFLPLNKRILSLISFFITIPNLS